MEESNFAVRSTKRRSTPDTFLLTLTTARPEAVCRQTTVVHETAFRRVRTKLRNVHYFEMVRTSSCRAPRAVS